MVRPIEERRQEIDNQILRSSNSSAPYYVARLADVLWVTMQRITGERSLARPPQMGPRAVTPTPVDSDSEEMEEAISPQTSINSCVTHSPER